MGGRRGRWRKDPWRERGQGGGSRGKEVAEEWEREVETPGTSERRGQDQRGVRQKDGIEVGEAKPPRARPQGERRNGTGGGKGSRAGPDGGAEFGVRKQGRQAGGARHREQAVRQSCPREGGGVQSRPSRERDREKES